MALPKFLAPSLTPQELTFIAEDEPIDIVPLFKMSKVRLISGVYGPFQPPAKATVPLWLALSLKRKRKCRIVGPDWLTVENLQALVQTEKDNPEAFVPIPRHFVEISKVLLDEAPDDLSSPSQLHSILLSLRHVRLSKIRTGLRPPVQTSASAASGTTDTGAFSGGGDYLRLTGLTPIEIAEMRGFLGGVMGVMSGLSFKGEGEGDGEENQDDDMGA